MIAVCGGNSTGETEITVQFSLVDCELSTGSEAHGIEC